MLSLLLVVMAEDRKLPPVIQDSTLPLTTLA